MNTFSPKTLNQWRQWLTDYHATVPEVWLVFHKTHTGIAAITYTDALDEALCFGWVDSLVKRLDDDRYARKFTPRRADSRWSEINRKRYAVLEASGRLTPAGIQRPPTQRGYAPLPARFTMPSKMPAYIQEALKRHPAALRHFEELSPSHQRRYLGWIESAKRDETKARRIEETIRLLTAGKTLGLK
jgi:uncharacterized protein YdeI (YjbR/CyaY-like superfamily)